MEIPPVLIVANPYEAELCRKALVPAGISVSISDGGEDLLEELAGDKLAVVIASGLYMADADEVVRIVQKVAPDVPLLLIAEDEHDLSEIAGRQRFCRPVDLDEFAHAIERLAVELEGNAASVDAELDIFVDRSNGNPLDLQVIPRINTERLGTFDRVPTIASPELGLPTTDLEPSGPIRVGSLLSADDALLDALPSIEPVAPMRTVRSSSEKVPDRPTPVLGLAALKGDLAALARNSLLDDIDLDAIDVGAPRPPTRSILPLPVVADAQTARKSLFDDPELAPVAMIAGTEEEGDLGYVDIAELLSRLSQGRWNGRLLVERSDGGKSIYFEDGLPVAATSDFLIDRLGDILHRDGKLNREQHARTRQLQPFVGKSGANELCDAGLLKQREIFTLLRRHTEEVFFSLFAWESGTYRLRPQTAPAEDRVRPGQPVIALILEGLRRKYSLERLSELTGPIETVLSPTTELQRILGELPLVDGERRAVELIDGDRSLKDILFAERGLPGGVSEASLYALAWLLLCSEALQVGEGSVGLDARGLPTQVTPASVGRVRDRREHGRDDGSDSDSDRGIERERILAKLDQLVDADYFSLLGVERHATSHEIRRAYERLIADFAFRRFSVAVQTELAPAIQEIGQVLSEAHRVLSDEALRSSYRSQLVDSR